MAQELGRLSGPVPASEQPLTVTDRVPRKKTPYIAAGAVAAAAVVGVTWFIVGSLRPRVPVTLGGPVAVLRQPGTGGSVAPAATAAGENAQPTATADNAQPTAEGTAPATQPPTVFEPTTVGRPAPKVITVEKPVVLKPPASLEAKGTAPLAPASPALALAEAKRMLQKARESVVAERYAEAEDLYNRVRASGLERAPALTGLAEVAFQRGSYPEAVRLGHRAVESGGGVPATMVLGNSYFKLGKYDDAITQYREVLRTDAEHQEAKANLAAAQKRKGS
jgi:hypothetical protein